MEPASQGSSPRLSPVRVTGHGGEAAPHSPGKGNRNFLYTNNSAFPFPASPAGQSLSVGWRVAQ